MQAGREQRVAEFRKSLAPLRMTVSMQPYLGGEQPHYADYLAFGGFQWARSISPFRVLEADDAMGPWLGRMLDLHDGLARRTEAYYGYEA